MLDNIVDCSYTIPADRLSAELADLLTQLLNKEPSARPSLEQVMEHPWLREAEPASNHLLVVTRRLSVDGLQRSGDGGGFESTGGTTESEDTAAASDCTEGKGGGEWSDDAGDGRVHSGDGRSAALAIGDGEGMSSETANEVAKALSKSPNRLGSLKIKRTPTVFVQADNGTFLVGSSSADADLDLDDEDDLDEEDEEEDSLNEGEEEHEASAEERPTRRPVPAGRGGDGTFCGCILL
mmetsp:Transcript_11442/g.46304  ORF Transcript_11442/g.46304 Transcript_11442/m.46304 type:complete len:238 (+) Transcript_11442:164-877(+)